MADQEGTTILDVRNQPWSLATEQSVRDLIGESLGQNARVVIVSIEQCGDSFFNLSSRLAGEVVQKFVNYGIRLVIVGDINAAASNSTALRDFVRECNRGRQIWFVADESELNQRLQN